MKTTYPILKHLSNIEALVQHWLSLGHDWSIDNARVILLQYWKFAYIFPILILPARL